MNFEGTRINRSKGLAGSHYKRADTAVILVLPLVYTNICKYGNTRVWRASILTFDIKVKHVFNEMT